MLFIYSTYRAIQSFVHCYYIVNIKKYDLDAAIFSLTLCNDYRVYLFTLIPIIGILIKNKLGWICIASYIYFIQINCISQNYMDKILLCISAVILLALLIIINTKVSILTYYKISPKNNIIINVIALLLGAILSYLLIILK